MAVWNDGAWTYSSGVRTLTTTIDGVDYTVKARFDGKRLAYISIVTNVQDASLDTKTNASEAALDAAMTALKSFIEANEGTGSDKAF